MVTRPETIPPTPPAASINRIKIVDLPGLPVDEEARGESAYHLLSGPALVRYAQASGAALGLPAAWILADPDSPEARRDLPRAVDARLRDPDPAVRRAATAIARRLGRNLGIILLTLSRGDAANRAARPDWPPEAWETWAGVRHVWLGGGLVSGDLGMAAVDAARSLLSEPSVGAAITVERSPWPQHMPILGACRYLPAREAPRWHALCLDLGQTSAKRAVVTVEKGRLARLTWLPQAAVGWRWRNDPTAKEAITGTQVLAFVAETIAEGLQAAADLGLPVVDDIAISIAAYTRGARLLGNGIYAQIHQLGDDAPALIADRVATTCGVRPALALIHDGTAAATLHAGHPHSAVIVVGTALGVGFPPASAAGLLPLAPALTLHEAT